MFLKISQISRETPVLESLFNKVVIGEIFKKAYFEEHLGTTAPEKSARPNFW